MINIVLIVLLILLIRTEFSIGGVFVTKCNNCDHIEQKKAYDDEPEEWYHYCKKLEMEVSPSDACCEYYE